MKMYKTVAAAAFVTTAFIACLFFGATTAHAASAQALTAQINGISGLTAAVSASDPNAVNVSGDAVATSTIILNVDQGVSVNWGANLTGGISGKYILNISGAGIFNLTGKFNVDAGGMITPTGASAEISNRAGGAITVTGACAQINICDGGGVRNTAGGSGMSINIAADGVALSVGGGSPINGGAPENSGASGIGGGASINGGGKIVNEGSNSAVNVAAGAKDVYINVTGGEITSLPAGYAINDGGTALCQNNTRIEVNGGKVTAGSACAVKSTGENSRVTITGGVVSNSATVNSNPVVYMNGGVGDNVYIGGDGAVNASNNNLGYGIQTTGNVTVSGNAKVTATSGRAVNLVGMNSVITVNGGAVSATNGVAICTATTNPATVTNTEIIINGGEVYITDPKCQHGEGRPIYATGDNSRITVNGGWVFTLSNYTEAIYLTGPNSVTTVNGGWVSAGDHFAIEAYNGGTVIVKGGFVFAYGTAPVSPKTGSAITASAVGAISYDRVSINGNAYEDGGAGGGAAGSAGGAGGGKPWDGYDKWNGGGDAGGNGGNGVVAVWDRKTWIDAPWSKGEYTEGYANHLASAPGELIIDADPPAGPPGAAPANRVRWQSCDISAGALYDNETQYTGGIRYENGTNAGFFPLADVAVVKTSHIVTVINGAGTGSYKTGETVSGIAANRAPAGMTFSHWEVNLSGIDPYKAEVDPFVMPDDDIVVMAVYKDITYRLTSIGAVPDASGDYKAGAMVKLVAGDAPKNREFDKWVYAGPKLRFLKAESPAAWFEMPGGEAQITATYKDAVKYTFTIIGGTVAGGNAELYYAGDEIRINAPSAFPPNYRFSGWSVVSGGGSFQDAFEPFTVFTMPASDAVITMNQPINAASGAMLSLGVVNGEITQGVGPYSAGQPVSIKAAPAPRGQAFAYWSISSGSGVFADAGAESTKFLMSDRDTIIRADYKPIEYPLFVEYGAIVNDGDPGANSALFAMGTAIRLTTKAPESGKYMFDGWSASGGVLANASAGESGSDSYAVDFIMPDDAAIVTANWIPLYQLLVAGGKITAVNGAPAGEDNESGYFLDGDEIEVAAGDGGGDGSGGGSAGYMFAGWQSNNGGVFDDATSVNAVFTMPASGVTISAGYIETSVENLKLTVVNGTGEAADKGSGWNECEILGAGDVISVSAVAPAPGMVFVMWSVQISGEKGGASIGGKPNLNYGVLGNAYSANTAFIMPDQSVTVTAEFMKSASLDIINGRVASSDATHIELAEGASVRVEAGQTVPVSGQVFSGWIIKSGGGSFENANAAETVFTIFSLYPDASDEYNAAVIKTEIEAIFTNTEKADYLLTTTDCHADKPGPFAEGANIEVTVAADVPLGKAFTGWVVAGAPYAPVAFSDPPIIKIAMPPEQPCNVDVVAKFQTVEYNLTVINGGGGGRRPAGEHAEIAAAPAPAGKMFSSWIASGGGAFIYGDRASDEYIMPANDAVVTAVYIDKPSADRRSANYAGQPISAQGDVGGSGPDASGAAATEPGAAATEPGADSGRSPGDVSHILNTHDHIAYVIGVGDGLFAPQKDMTRAEAAQMFYNLLIGGADSVGDDGAGDGAGDGTGNGAVGADGGSYGVMRGGADGLKSEPARAFPDVAAGEWYEPAVSALASIGVINGRPDGRYYPDDPITRAEFVAIATRFTDEASGVRPDCDFTDVSINYWAYGYIAAATSYGWIQGVGDGRFDPDRHISRAEVVTLTNRMLGRSADRAYFDGNTSPVTYADVPKNHWAYYDIMEASIEHNYVRRPEGEEWLF